MISMVLFLSLAVHWKSSISRRPFGPAGLFSRSGPLKRNAESLVGWPGDLKIAFRLLMGWAVSSSVERQ